MNPIEVAAERLVAARRGAMPASAPGLPDAPAAYRVQDAVAAALEWFDSRGPKHWKSGGSATDAIQTHAPLPPAGVWSSPADGRQWPLRMRGIEVEVALRLGFDVDAATAATITTAAAAALIDARCVSIEVVDSRWAEGLEASADDRLADLQSHGALVLGAWSAFRPDTDDPRWATQVCRVRLGTAPEKVFRGSHGMGGPTAVLAAWLRHATRGGSTVSAGTVVTTGTWCGLLEAVAGERIEVVFDGIGTACLQL